MKADLHTHSTASDGQYNPLELVKKAEETGIELFAITDHDTVNGSKIVFAHQNEFTLKFISGIEFGSKEASHLHILGYNFDINSEIMTKACDVLQKSRMERKFRIIDYLNKHGIKITADEVESEAGSDLIARPHFALVMVKKGYVNSVNEAFQKYLDTDEFQKIERFKYSAQECIDIIHRSGGKAVLAHPMQLKLPANELNLFIYKLVDYGLDGIECYYPDHSDDETTYLLNLAEKYGLFTTAGSDFHGENIKGSRNLISVEINGAKLLN